MLLHENTMPTMQRPNSNKKPTYGYLHVPILIIEEKKGLSNFKINANHKLRFLKEFFLATTNFKLWIQALFTKVEVKSFNELI